MVMFQENCLNPHGYTLSSILVKDRRHTMNFALVKDRHHTLTPLRAGSAQLHVAACSSVRVGVVSTVPPKA